MVEDTDRIDEVEAPAAPRGSMAELGPELPHAAGDDRDAAGEVEQRVPHGGDPTGERSRQLVRSPQVSSERYDPCVLLAGATAIAPATRRSTSSTTTPAGGSTPSVKGNRSTG